MTKNEFFEICRNAKKIDMLISCKNANLEIGDKAFNVAPDIFDSEEFNNILNETDTGFVLKRAEGFKCFVPDIDWNAEKEVIEVME